MGKSTLNEILCLKFSKDNKTLIAGCMSELLFFTFQNSFLKMTKGVWQYSQQPTLCIGVGEGQIVTGVFTGNLYFWKLNGNQDKKTIKAHDEAITSMYTKQNFQEILTGSKDGQIKIWRWDVEGQGQEQN